MQKPPKLTNEKVETNLKIILSNKKEKRLKTLPLRLKFPLLNKVPKPPHASACFRAAFRGKCYETKGYGVHYPEWVGLPKNGKASRLQEYPCEINSAWCYKTRRNSSEFKQTASKLLLALLIISLPTWTATSSASMVSSFMRSFSAIRASMDRSENSQLHGISGVFPWGPITQILRYPAKHASSAKKQSNTAPKRMKINCNSKKNVRLGGLQA